MRTSTPAPRNPRSVAVIIPCYNEELYIGQCLDSLLANDYPSELLDIVVVDGMSSDKTRGIVGRYAEEHPHIRLLDNPGRLKPIALNRGIKNTSSDVLIRVDAHAVYEDRYISKLVSGLCKHNADNIGGVRDTHEGRTGFSRAIACVISHPMAVGNAHWRTGVKKPRKVDTVFCGCYRREVFDRIGYFNENLVRTQDREFNLRLIRAGGTIILDPNIRCTYFPRVSWGNYVRWTYVGAQWLFYAPALTDVRMTAWRNLVPSAFVIYHCAIASLPFLNLPPAVAACSLFPLALYWLLVFGVSLRVAARKRCPAMLPFLLLLFPLTHLSYGAGAIHGFLKRLSIPRGRKAGA